MYTLLSALALASAASAASWSVVANDVATVATGIAFSDSNTGEPSTPAVVIARMRVLQDVLGFV